MDGTVSTTINIDIGTPQGSRISPLLFCIMMADLDLYTNQSGLINFADDTQSIVVSDTKEEMIDVVKRESQEIIKFFQGNNLVNNPDKLALIHNSKGKTSTITFDNIGGQEVTSKTSDKLLGVSISSSLDWTHHVDTLCGKLKQRLGMLRRIKHKIPRDKLKIVAEAIFNSKLRYAISVYLKPRLTEEDEQSKDLQRLQVLQNDMIRLINGKRRSQHTNMKELRAEMKMMSVNQMTVYHALLETFNIKNHGSVESIRQKLTAPEAGPD